VRRHRVDPVALLAGALFVAVGAAYLNAALDDTDVHARWILPSLLIALGLGGLLATLLNMARQRRQSPSEVTGEAPEPAGGLPDEPTEAVPRSSGDPEPADTRTVPIEPADERRQDT
jgi:hypothetical protein